MAKTAKQPAGGHGEPEPAPPAASYYKSKFKEGTLGSRSSIHPPPDELWKDLNIEHMIDRFHAEANIPPPAWSVADDMPGATSTVAQQRPAAAARVASGGSNASGSYSTSADGPFSRLSRALTSWFNGASALGKRKAGSDAAEKPIVDPAADGRRREVEEAYRLAKEHGLLPIPTVLVRPATRARPVEDALASSISATSVSATSISVASTSVTSTSATFIAVPTTPAANSLTLAITPRTPALYKTPSRRDLHKQKKLSKRVSDLEHKLQEARKELTLALGPHNPNPVPPLPSLSTNLPPTPTTNPSYSASEASPSHNDTANATPTDHKIVKKRKATREGCSDGEYKPIPTDTETDTDFSLARASDSDAYSTKRAKITPSKKSIKKKSTRLTKKRTSSSQGTEKDDVVTVVPDGVAVPPIPNIPNGVRGKRVAVKKFCSKYAEVMAVSGYLK